jgi:sugar lactone lactonase YvrE
VPSQRATLAIDARNGIGDGPAWDAAAHRLIWSDHETGVITEAQSDGVGGWRETGAWNVHAPLAAAIPRSGGGLVVAGGTDIFMLDADGNIAPFTRIDADPKRVRLNDAKCDPRGRLWAGTLALDFSPSAGLYRIDPDGSVTVMLQNARLANGLDWSPDGTTFYFIDSLARTLDAFDFDLNAGTIANRRNVITLQRGCGLPNGMTVDRQGCLWLAATGAGEVRRYTPEGKLLGRVTISTPAATSCAFGGPGGADLFITSRRGRLPEIALHAGVAPEMMENNGPEAGGLFVCRPGQTGMPATPFAG